jgi:hypothetical protein
MGTGGRQVFMVRITPRPHGSKRAIFFSCPAVTELDTETLAILIFAVQVVIVSSSHLMC